MWTRYSADAHVVVKRKFKIGRKQALCLEGRGCVAGYRENTFTLTVWMSHQLPYVVRHYLAKHLRMAETDVRVIIPHTGGGFGQKASIYPEEFVCAHLALTLRRPVKWVEDRIENMVASTHARDQTIELRDGGGQAMAASSRSAPTSGSMSAPIPPISGRPAWSRCRPRA